MQIDELIREIINFADICAAGSDPFPVGLPGVTLVRQRRPTYVYPVVYQPIFCLVLQGEKQTMLGDRLVRFARLQSFVVGLDMPAKAQVVKASPREPYVALAVELDLNLINELAGAVSQGALEDERALAVHSGETEAPLVDAMRRMFDLRDRHEAQPVLFPLILKEIHYWLLVSEQGSLLRQLAKKDSHAARISKAIAVIKGSYSAALRVDDLADVAGMSVSGFHASFREITGTSPLQFQKQLRLIEARRLLKWERLRVAEAAYHVGYESPTQFSREYSRVFGVSPRKDRTEVSHDLAEPAA